jgi:hypothetical protein
LEEERRVEQQQEEDEERHQHAEREAHEAARERERAEAEEREVVALAEERARAVLAEKARRAEEEEARAAESAAEEQMWRLAEEQQELARQIEREEREEREQRELARMSERTAATLSAREKANSESVCFYLIFIPIASFSYPKASALKELASQPVRDEDDSSSNTQAAEKNPEGSELVRKLDRMRQALPNYSMQPDNNDVASFLANFARAIVYASALLVGAFRFCLVWFLFSFFFFLVSLFIVLRSTDRNIFLRHPV